MGSLNLKAVLFDLGGTIHHYHREEVFRAILKERGIDARTSEGFAPMM
jgi:FMN phosphatase YigB (HAD superfamily)